MTQISDTELKKIVEGIIEDRESIIRHNPIGPPEEILFWMLLSSLVVYLNLSDLEAPCYTGRPDAATYRAAIEFVLKDRLSNEFDLRGLLDKLSAAA